MTRTRTRTPPEAKTLALPLPNPPAANPTVTTGTAMAPPLLLPMMSLPNRPKLALLPPLVSTPMALLVSLPWLFCSLPSND